MTEEPRIIPIEYNPNGQKDAQGIVGKPWPEMSLEELRLAHQDLLDQKAEVTAQKDALFEQLQRIKANIRGLTE